MKTKQQRVSPLERAAILEIFVHRRLFPIVLLIETNQSMLSLKCYDHSFVKHTAFSFNIFYRALLPHNDRRPYTKFWKASLQQMMHYWWVNRRKLPLQVNYKYDCTFKLRSKIKHERYGIGSGKRRLVYIAWMSCSL